MRMLLAALAGSVLAATTAAAQPAASRFSLNLGAGSVGSTSNATPPPGPVTLVSIGTDVRLSNHWGLRLEAGRRTPSTSHERISHSVYYFPNPEAPADIRASIGLPSTTRSTEQYLFDAAVLIRYARPVRSRLEVAFLTGLDLHAVRFRHHTTIPASLNPGDVHVFEGDTRHTLGVFDFGIDGGVRIGERWSVLAYGLAGLQSPLEEHRRTQMRAGGLLKRTF
jgi:hypothetical protein